MSLLRRGNRRGRRGIALVAAGALMAFQALAIVGAVPALAVGTCDFTAGAWTISLPANLDGVIINVNTAATGDIEVDVNPGVVVCTGGISLLSNTTSFNITGGAGDQSVLIDLDDDGDDTIDWGTINWTINLGTGTGDSLDINANGADDPVSVVFGASGININADADLDVTQAGVEVFTVEGGTDEDTISAAGDTTTGAAFATGVTATAGADDDTVSGGAGNDDLNGQAGDDTVSGGLGDDTLNGGEGGETDGDTLDYSAAAAAVNANLTNGVATGEGLDSLTLASFENLVGSAQGDTLTGDSQSNVITPGAGDDKNDGASDFDYIDYGDATAAVTVDLAANTATGGSGNDSLTSIEGAFGSGFDDTFIDQTDEDNEYFGDDGNDVFKQGASASSGEDDILDGESGTDTVDYGARTSDLNVTLNGSANTTCGPGATSGESGETDCIHTTENANLGTGDDTFKGNEFNNVVKPGGGQNVLDGEGGSDTLDYSNYTAGVTVNMAGGSTAGDSAVDFENAKGSPQKDNITGNELSNTLKAGKGNDNVKGGAGDDTVRGGPGKDMLRGGTGDDDLFGGGGNDTLNGGAGTDLCKGGKGKDKKRGCELGGKG